MLTTGEYDAGCHSAEAARRRLRFFAEKLEEKANRLWAAAGEQEGRLGLPVISNPAKVLLDRVVGQSRPSLHLCL
jgi:hypothetical protein